MRFTVDERGVANLFLLACQKMDESEQRDRLEAIIAECVRQGLAAAQSELIRRISLECLSCVTDEYDSLVEEAYKDGKDEAFNECMAIVARVFNDEQPPESQSGGEP